jgi:5-methyltetrahydrofolate--homocysteine methyltransferase
MTDTQDLIAAILEGDESKTKLMVMEALDQGYKAGEIMNKGMIAAMDIVGEKMENEELFIPEVLMSARAMSAGVKLLKPHLSESEEQSADRGVAVIGSVQGDLHDIGKNLVKMLLEGAGFTVIDLGTNVETQQFLSAIKENNATILGMSALLTTTMPIMKDVIDSLKKNKIRDQVKVLIGGAPVSEEYAKEIGADGYGADAGSAVRLARTLTQS